MDFSFWIIVKAGLIATVPMILFMHMASIITRQQFRIISILGTMLTAETTITKKISASPRSILTGTITVFATGILASYIFYSMVGGKAGFSITAAFAFLTIFCVAGVAAWKVFFYIHANPPYVPFPGFLWYMAGGNMLFTSVLFLVYRSWN